jgi:glycosyltransferase involved in cell wall biosynthesis
MKVNTAQESSGKHGYDRQEGGFESASVVLPVINEVRLLYQTIDTIFEYAGESIREVIIIVCHKTTAESLSACKELGERYAGQIRVIRQRLPFLGGALQEGIPAARGSHVIVMFSDGESDPRSVGDLISEARKNPEAIISASRWLKGNSFEGYPAVKTLLNYLFQKAFSLLYWKNITDFTFG